MTPTFALVTPSYNQAAYLPACIDSVLAQQGCSVNYLVSDGGSADGSAGILRRYGARVHWRSGPDGGQVRAINAGLQSLPGDICGYLNSDDILLPGSLAAVAETFALHPEADVVYGEAWFIDDERRRTRPYPTLPLDEDAFVQHCLICRPASFLCRRIRELLGWIDTCCRLLPGARDQRLYGLAWLPYVLCRRRLGGPLFYRPGDFRC